MYLPDDQSSKLKTENDSVNRTRSNAEYQNENNNIAMTNAEHFVSYGEQSQYINKNWRQNVHKPD